MTRASLLTRSDGESSCPPTPSMLRGLELVMYAILALCCVTHQRLHAGHDPLPSASELAKHLRVAWQSSPRTDQKTSQARRRSNSAAPLRTITKLASARSGYCCQPLHRGRCCCGLRPTWLVYSRYDFGHSTSGTATSGTSTIQPCRRRGGSSMCRLGLHSMATQPGHLATGQLHCTMGSERGPAQCLGSYLYNPSCARRFLSDRCCVCRRCTCNRHHY